MMTYQGTVSNGVVIFEPGVVLPEGVKVSIELDDSKPSTNQIAPKEDQPVETPQAEKEFKFEMKNGIPIFPRADNDFRPTMEFINELRDEYP